MKLNLCKCGRMPTAGLSKTVGIFATGCDGCGRFIIGPDFEENDELWNLRKNNKDLVHLVGEMFIDLSCYGMLKPERKDQMKSLLKSFKEKMK